MPSFTYLNNSNHPMTKKLTNKFRFLKISVASYNAYNYLNCILIKELIAKLYIYIENNIIIYLSFFVSFMNTKFLF